MKNLILIASLIIITSIGFAQTNMNKDPEQTSKSTSIVFKSQIYDFGTVEYGEDAIGEFIFKNVSKNPISLTNVRASCGCTGTEWPRETINRRKKGTISVTYDTKRVGKFHKNVYVYVDGNKNPIQLEVKGEVLPSKDVSNIPPKTTSKTPKHIKIDGNVKSANPNASKSKSSLNSSSNIKKEELKRVKMVKEEDKDLAPSKKEKSRISEKKSVKSE